MNSNPLQIDLIKPSTETELEIRLANERIAAGFPSPAEDYTDLSLDLNKELIRNPSSTFFARVKGVSMIDEGINDGDLLVIDKSKQPHDGSLAVCYVDGEFTLKRVKVNSDSIWLMPANPNFKPIIITSENDFVIWGIVLYVIKKM